MIAYAALSIGYYIDDYENGDWFSTNDLYSITFDLNDDNKFDITETYSYKILVAHNILMALQFFGLNDDITSLNLETGQYKRNLTPEQS